jgi:hypothetical protein
MDMRNALTFFLLLLGSSSWAGWIMNPSRFASEGEDYSDIIAYHNCDSNSANLTKAGGSATVTYDPGILSVGGVIGNAWDNNNDGYDDVQFVVDGNMDYASGRIGFYFTPQENAAGIMIYISTTTGDLISYFYAQWTTPDDMVINFKGTGANCTGANFSTGTAYFMEFKFNGNTVTVYKDGTGICGATDTDAYVPVTIHLGSIDGNAWDAHYDQFISTSDPDRSLYAVKDVTNFE